MMFRKVENLDPNPVFTDVTVEDVYFFTPPAMRPRVEPQAGRKRSSSMIGRASKASGDEHFDKEKPYFYTPPSSPHIKAGC
jgi:hypothetical protein